MARSPGGKSVGRVSIRVIPDASRFREDLKTALERIERAESVKIDASLAARERFHRDVRDLVDSAERHKINLDVAARTAAATAQLRYVTRPRMVWLEVRVRRASLLAAESVLLRLTGLRVAGDWAERLFRSLGDMDKALPRVALLTTGITSAVSVLLAAFSQLLGIGAGLTAILPALLVVPGLLAGAALSVVTLGIALADAKEQLAVLGPEMRELGTIIQTEFWREARAPIIQLVTNLLPQLRESVRATSTAIGGFVAGMAKSFDREFAGGRFEAVFAGLPATFRELTRGTDAFAGAIVSLGLVSARYVPRLARWFVDLSIRFETFLKRTAEDGRLDGWIEGAIVAMDDLWRATAATGRALAGLWRAAEAAGGGGLGGFAHQMERIDRAINSPGFQTTMSAIFRGASVATAAFAEGLRDIGTLLHDRRADVEYFIGTAGDAFGGFISAIADAFNTPEFGGSLRDFISGLDRGLDKFGLYLPGIASAASSLLSFAGEFAETLGPTLGIAAEAVGGLLKPILDTLSDGTLQSLGDTIKTALEGLGPKLVEAGERLAPLVDTIVRIAEDVIPHLGTALGELLGGFNARTPDDRPENPSLIWGAGEYLGGGTLLSQVQILTDALEGQNITVNALNGEYGVMWYDIQTGIIDTVAQFANFGRASGESLSSTTTALENFRANLILNLGRVATVMQGLAQHVFGGVAEMAVGVLATILTLPAKIVAVFSGAGTMLWEAGRALVQGLINGMSSLLSGVINTAVAIARAALTGLKGELRIKSPSRRVYDEVGVPTIQGWVNAIRDNGHLVAEELVKVARIPAMPDVDYGGVGASMTQALGGLAQNVVNLTVNNPVGVPTEESVRRESQLIGAGLAV